MFFPNFEIMQAIAFILCLNYLFFFCVSLGILVRKLRKTSWGAASQTPSLAGTPIAS
jgi:hypothetical protein